MTVRPLEDSAAGLQPRIWLMAWHRLCTQTACSFSTERVYCSFALARGHGRGAIPEQARVSTASGEHMQFMIISVWCYAIVVVSEFAVRAVLSSDTFIPYKFRSVY